MAIALTSRSHRSPDGQVGPYLIHTIYSPHRTAYGRVPIQESRQRRRDGSQEARRGEGSREQGCCILQELLPLLQVRLALRFVHRTATKGVYTSYGSIVYRWLHAWLLHSAFLVLASSLR